MSDPSAAQTHLVEGQRKLLCFADTDSYIKWAANLISEVPPEYSVKFVLVNSAQLPSDRQLEEALAGTKYAGLALDVLTHRQMKKLVAQWQPDVVFGAARGFVVAAYFDELFDNDRHRPVLVSGLPGISVPALPNGVRSRRGADVFVLHSHQEVQDYQELAARLQVPVKIGLASLPYLRVASTEDTPDVARNEVVFATQAKVPKTHWERMEIVSALAETAKAHPQWQVVIKVRALAGEAQTHAEKYAFQDLLVEYGEEHGGYPDNLVVAGGPMLEHLHRAVGLVTVSSTAVVEAVAQGVPVITLDDFGISRGLINIVFAESGLMGGSADVIAGDFRKPTSEWLRAHYFHNTAENNWWDLTSDCVNVRDATGLGALRKAKPGVLSTLRMQFYKHQAFVPEQVNWKYKMTDSWWRFVLKTQRSFKDRSGRRKPVKQPIDIQQP